MKKVLVLFSILVLTAGFVTAQDSEGIGLTAGLEFGAGNVSKANEADMTPYLMPMIIYENSFLDGALDFSAELDYTFGFTKMSADDDSSKVFPQSLYFDAALGYNFFLSDTSTLSILLENENDAFILSPRSDDESIGNGVLIPGFKFNHGFDFGDLYVQADVPLFYLQEGPKNQDFGIDLDFTLGWASTFGLGIEFIDHNFLQPDTDYAGLDVIISYENGPVYAEVEVDTYEDKEYGVTVIPEFDYSFNSFIFYINCEFDAVGADSGDVIISPALGVKYSF